ncbi:hypothetical protein FB645_000225 [Coemansia sp. IMI 203386]|nr:hypothetical protein FB645_000225 [Coemansia sp. IMI 203386]
MATEADEWLQLLSQHPIFLEPPLLQLSTAKSENRASIRRERLVVQGTDLFVAVGNEVRRIDLKACKDAFAESEIRRLGAQNGASKHEAIRSVPWVRLGCEALTFDICKLIVSSNKKLLAAIGTHDVAVVVIPARSAVVGRNRRSGAFDSARFDSDSDENSNNDKNAVGFSTETKKGRWIDCRSMSVGDTSLTTGLRIVDAMWHAMSTTCSHLVVLHANGMLRMYDVSESVDEPEQTASVFGTGFSATRAVSLTMGSAIASGWTRVTAYIATSDGAIYALCPLIPRRCSIERSWLASLHETASLDVREWQAEEYETSEAIYSPPELVEARAATSWLSKVIAHIGDGGAERVFLTLPKELLRSPAAQGPFLMQPAPAPIKDADLDTESDDESDDECDDASAALRLETPGGLGFIVVAYSDAHLDVFADLEPVIGRWANGDRCANRERAMPVLATLTSIDLTIKPLVTGDEDRSETDNRPSGAVALVNDPLSGSVFYALHPHGAHRIDLRTFGTLLDNAIGQQGAGANAAMDRLAGAKPSVQCVVHTNQCAGERPAPVVGVAVIDDIYLSYSLLALVEPNQLVGASLPLIPEADDGSGKEDQQVTGGSTKEPRRLDISPGAKDVVYVPRLPPLGYKSPEEVAVSPPRMVLRDDGSGDGVTGNVSEAKLRLLGEVVGQLRSQLSAISQAHASMRTHLDLQVQEHRRQHTKLTAISAGFQRHFDQLRQSQRRIDNLRDNASRQTMRVDHMLRQLITHYQPELTPVERAFVQEVRGMDRGVNGTSGYLQAVDRLQERLKDMRALAKAANVEEKIYGKAAGCGNDKSVAEEELDDIEDTIEHEQAALAETCERIAELKIRLEDSSS